MEDPPNYSAWLWHNIWTPIPQWGKMSCPDSPIFCRPCSLSDVAPGFNKDLKGCHWPCFKWHVLSFLKLRIRCSFQLVLQQWELLQAWVSCCLSTSSEHWVFSLAQQEQRWIYSKHGGGDAFWLTVEMKEGDQSRSWREFPLCWHMRKADVSTG